MLRRASRARSLFTSLRLESLALLLALHVSLLATGCAPVSTQPDPVGTTEIADPLRAENVQPKGLQASLWTRTSAERDGLTQGLFRMAADAIVDGVVERKSSDATAPTKPLAIIVDLDETVLDNVDYQLMLAETDTTYSQESWSAWVRRDRVSLIPGARAFVSTLEREGIAVFFVSNRLEVDREPTMLTLARLGFPREAWETRTLLKTTTSDKSARRAEVESRGYEIIGYVGDDLGDFPGGREVSNGPEAVFARRRFVVENADKWGTEWFVLPNAMYGSWERALPSMNAAEWRRPE